MLNQMATSSAPSRLPANQAAAMRPSGNWTSVAAWADSATLGTTAGKDEAADKPTYVALMGLEGAKTYADALTAQAMQALADTGLPEARLAALRALAAWVVERNN
jgi:geranylgeranyl pyrophosphate synthase